MNKIGDSFIKKYKNKQQQLGGITTFFDDSTDLKKSEYQIALVGVGCKADEKSFYAIRESFYDLYHSGNALSILDFGNVGADEKQIKEIASKAKKLKTVLIFLCETEEISTKIISLHNDKNVETALVLPNVTSNNKHIENLFLKEKRDVSVACFQNYFSDGKLLSELNNKYCETIRLGEFRNNAQTVEPMIRDAENLVIDMSAVRCSDGGTTLSPNGLYAEELCTIANFAGLSNNISQLNVVCGAKCSATTAQLVAQTLWHFVDNISNRIIENPPKTKLKKFIVNMGSAATNLTFYKSNLTNRWWLEVMSGKQLKIVACTYTDYQTACAKDIPVRWLRESQKMR